jgi:hypothetical protein
MTKFKVTVQFLKDFQIEAENAEEAKTKAAEEAKALNFSEKIFAQEPKNLDIVRKDKKKKGVSGNGAK